MTSWMQGDDGWTPPRELQLTWRDAIAIAIRDGLQCRVCDIALVAEDERLFVRVTPDAGDDQENVALVCAACATAHGHHPEPIPVFGDRLPTLT
jgi:hypothetical protein